MTDIYRVPASEELATIDARMAIIDAELSKSALERPGDPTSRFSDERRSLILRRRHVYSAMLSESSDIKPGDYITFVSPKNPNATKRGIVVELGGYIGSLHYTVRLVTKEGAVGSRTIGVPHHFQVKKVGSE